MDRHRSADRRLRNTGLRWSQALLNFLLCFGSVASQRPQCRSDWINIYITNMQNINLVVNFKVTVLYTMTYFLIFGFMIKWVKVGFVTSWLKNNGRCSSLFFFGMNAKYKLNVVRSESVLILAMQSHNLMSLLVMAVDDGWSAVVLNHSENLVDMFLLAWLSAWSNTWMFCFASRIYAIKYGDITINMQLLKSKE